MNLSEFIQLMHKYIGNEIHRADYVVWLFSLIVGEPVDEDDVEADDKGKYNPISDLGPDMLRKIYRGERLISPDNAKAILRHLSESQYTDKIYCLEDSQKELLVNDLKAYGFKASVGDVESVCTDLFLNLVKIYSEGGDTLSADKLKKRDSKGKLISEVPHPIAVKSMVKDKSWGSVALVKLVPKDLIFVIVESREP